MRPTNDSSLARAQREISFHIILSSFFFFFFFMVLAAIRFFRFDKFTDRFYFKKKSQVYLRLLMFTGLQFCSLLGDWGFLRERASSQATKRLSLYSLFSS